MNVLAEAEDSNVSSYHHLSNVLTTSHDLTQNSSVVKTFEYMIVRVTAALPQFETTHDNAN